LEEDQKMKMKKTLVLIITFILIIPVGCSFMSGLEDAQELAEKLLDDRFVYGGIGNTDYYSELFWKYTREADWEYLKNMVETNLGELQSYSLKSWEVQKKAKMGELSGTFVVLIYDTEYEYGAGQERITLMRGLWDRNFQIIGHYFESDVFG
jgi:hypothetical protein